MKKQLFEIDKICLGGGRIDSIGVVLKNAMLKQKEK